MYPRPVTHFMMMMVRWATLLFDTHVRQELLNYASTAMLFADRQVDPSIISCNRVVLLHVCEQS